MSIFKRLKFKKEEKVEEKKEGVEEKEEKKEKEEKEESGLGKTVITSINILQQPWLSEKATGLKKLNQYTFLIHPAANKKMVKEEIERRYGVKVEKVNIIRKKGKAKQWRGKWSHQPMLKKAIVTLKEGQKIEI